MLKTTFAMLSMVLVAACADADTADTPPDPEFGSEYTTGSADGLLPDEGSPAARAILDFVNAPIGDQADADALLRALSAVIHVVAAQNIVDTRVGVDGSPGSADDVEFASLARLDQVPYVGRAALGALHRHLAQTQPQTDCSEIVGTVVSTREQLTAIEHSGCTTFSRDVKIDVRTALPSAEYNMAALSRVRHAQGQLVVSAFPGATPSLPSLETVGGELQVEGVAGLSAPKLVSVGRLVAWRPVSAPALTTSGYVAVSCDYAHDLSSLATVGEFHINGGWHCQPMDLPALTRVDDLRFRTAVAEVHMPALTRVGRLSASAYDFSTTEIAIAVVEGEMRLERVQGLNHRFDQLVWVGGDLIVNEPGEAHDFAALQHVGGLLYLNFEAEIDSLRMFEGMTEQRSRIAIQAKCSEHTSITLFERLESATDISGDIRSRSSQESWSAVPCNVSAFANLEEAGKVKWGTLDARSFTKLDRARSVTAILFDGALPALTVVEHLETYHGAVGAAQLAVVEDELAVGWMTPNAFPSLESLGGNLRITDRQMGYQFAGYVAGFVDRLSYFGGEVVYR